MMNANPKVSRLRATVWAVSVPAAIWLAAFTWMSYTPSQGNIDVEAGSVTFRDHCGACHVLEKGITTHHGPNLYDVGRFAGQRRAGLSGPEYILESILEPDAFVAPENRQGMPRNLAQDLSPEEIRNVIGYLASRGTTPDWAAIAALEIPDQRGQSDTRTIRRETMELAARVMRDKAKCMECHSYYRNAEHGIFAPPIFAVGVSDRDMIRESIVDPSKVIAEAHRAVNVFLENGELVAGKLILRSDSQVTVMTQAAPDGPQLRTIALAEIEHEDGQPLIVTTTSSPMPAGFDELLTDEELDAVVTMIEQLN